MRIYTKEENLTLNAIFTIAPTMSAKFLEYHWMRQSVFDEE